MLIVQSGIVIRLSIQMFCGMWEKQIEFQSSCKIILEEELIRTSVLLLVRKQVCFFRPTKTMLSLDITAN